MVQALHKTGTLDLMRKLKKAGVDLRGKANETHRRICRHIFIDLVEGTPQYTGNLVSNWTVEATGLPPKPYHEIGERRYLESQGPDKYHEDFDVYAKGDDPGVAEVLARELPRLARIRYNSNVTFRNNTPYAQEVEENQGPNGLDIRKVNIRADYGAVAMVGYVDMKYNKLRVLRKLAE